MNRRRKLAEGRSHPACETLAFDREANAASRALREPYAKIRLERLDLVTDRPVRDVERFRSPR